MPEERKTGVALVEDHVVVREGLAALIDAQEDFRVVGEAGSAAEARELMQSCPARLWILDLRLGDGSGVDVCREITRSRPGDRCLILTSEDSSHAVRDAIEAGAAGFLLKRSSGESVCGALRIVNTGGSTIDPRAANNLFDAMRTTPPGARIDLTEQEALVLAHLAEGRSNQQIATAMFLSEKTIRNYVSRVLRKLGKENRTQAALHAATIDGLPDVS